MTQSKIYSDGLSRIKKHAQYVKDSRVFSIVAQIELQLGGYETQKLLTIDNLPELEVVWINNCEQKQILDLHKVNGRIHEGFFDGRKVIVDGEEYVWTRKLPDKAKDVPAKATEESQQPLRLVPREADDGTPPHIHKVSHDGQLRSEGTSE